jgi:Ankyrin repeats (3 copies)
MGIFLPNPSPESSQKENDSNSLAKAAIILACILWLLAVFLPVWETRSDAGEWNTVYGAVPAILGFLGIFAKCPAWFANLLLIPLCLTLFKGRRETFWLSVVAFAIAASAFMMPAIYGDNETDTIVGRKIGFYLWLGSFLVIMLAQALAANKSRPSFALVRWATVLFLVVGVIPLEFHFRISPLEAALKDPVDMHAFSAALANHPSQAEKDRALFWAIRQFEQEISQHERPDSSPVEQLIAAGVNVNEADDRSQTPLMVAVSSPGTESLVRLLLHAGANVNQADLDQDTPLMCAVARRGTEPVVKLLIQAGADVNARNFGGNSVLYFAEEGGSPETRQILLDAGAHESTKQRNDH